MLLLQVFQQSAPGKYEITIQQSASDVEYEIAITSCCSAIIGVWRRLHIKHLLVNIHVWHRGICIEISISIGISIDIYIDISIGIGIIEHLPVNRCVRHRSMAEETFDCSALRNHLESSHKNSNLKLSQLSLFATIFNLTKTQNNLKIITLHQSTILTYQKNFKNLKLSEII